MKKKLAAIVLVACVALAGCGKKIDAGTVVEKHYKPPHTQMMMMPMSMPNGNGGTTTILIPYFFHYPERWCVVIEGDYKGEIVRETYYISASDYMGVQIGDYISFAEIEGTTEEPHTKERA